MCVSFADEGRMKGLAFAYDPSGYWVELVKRSKEEAMTTMPPMTAVDVTLLSGSYLIAVGISSLMLMYDCTHTCHALHTASSL